MDVDSPSINQRIVDQTFEQVVTACPLAMMLLDLDGTVRMWNPAAERLYGWTADEVVGRFLPAIPIDKRDEFRRHLELVAQGQPIAGCETARLRKDGPFDASIWAVPVRDVGGDIRCLSIVQDVTDRRRANQAHAYLAAIVESSEDAIIGKDLNAVITSWNPAAERLYGYSAAEVIGRSISLLIPPDRPNELASIMQRLRRGERITHFETVRVRKDGTYLDVSVSISPIRDASGEIIGAASIARDITTQRAAERERQELLIRERTARARAESLQTITAALARALTVADVAQIVIERGLPGLGAAAGTVGLLTDDGTTVELVRALGYPDEMVAALRRTPITAATPMAEAARTGEPAWRDGDPTTDARFGDYPGRLYGYPTGAGLPLVADGRVTGAIGLSFREARTLSDEDRGFMLALAGQCAQALERVRLYETERASREQLDAILGGVADGVLVQREDGRFVYANDAAARLAGFASAAEYLQADTFEVSRRLTVLDAAGRPFSYEELPARRVLRGEPVAEMVVQFRRTDTNEVRWSITRARAVRGVGGELLAISIFHDITERIRSEERLRFLAEAGAQLAGSLDVEDTLGALARVATTTVADCAVVMLLGDGADLQAIAVSHRDPEQEDLIEELARRYPPQPDRRSRLWQAIQTNQSVIVPVITDELLERVARGPEHLRRTRELGLTSALYVPLVARGRTLGAMALFSADAKRRLGEADRAIAEEIARRAALALDNARLYSDAQEAIRARDEFLSIASHELRTPVTAILGIAQLMERARQRGTLDEARLDRSLTQMRQASERLASLTDDLLDVSRLQTGRFEVRPERLDVVSFTRELVDRYREQVDDRHTVILETDEGPCDVEADPARLEQVVANLLSNAVKYAPDGGPIVVTVCRDGDGVRVEVRDQGIGLPPGTEEAIFHPFGRAPNAAERQIPGLGLGLYVCRQIVERHGGRIWAESPGAGRGTTMLVWLPRAAPGDAAGA